MHNHIIFIHRYINIQIHCIYIERERQRESQRETVQVECFHCLYFPCGVDIFLNPALHLISCAVTMRMPLKLQQSPFNVVVNRQEGEGERGGCVGRRDGQRRRKTDNVGCQRSTHNIHNRLSCLEQSLALKPADQGQNRQPTQDLYHDSTRTAIFYI